MRVRPGAIWISGLSAAGKTTLAEGLVGVLHQRGVDNVVLLDGEAVRARLDRRYGHSLEDRFAVLERIVAIGREHVTAGDLVVVATISHQRRMRELARTRLAPFLEVCLRCPVDICRTRDHKGVYSSPSEEYVAGVTDPYEVSPPPALVIDTAANAEMATLGILVAATLEFLDLAPISPGPC
jgi:adenylylsulfate kinase